MYKRKNLFLISLYQPLGEAEYLEDKQYPDSIKNKAI